MDKSLLLFTISALLFFGGCVPPTEEIPTEINLDLKRKSLQKLYDFQDKQVLDSLYKYLGHNDPTFRYVATMAFASIKNPEALNRLYPMLEDRVEEVSVAAAYAIGQVGEEADENRLIAAFDVYDTLSQSKTNAAILEAVGKCGDEKMLESLATISTYQPSDTLLLEGQAWGLYRFALRGMISRKGTARMFEMATNRDYPPGVRFIAAYYLSRAKNIRLEDQSDKIFADAIAKEEDPRIRMALAIALGKTKTPTALNALVYQFNIERDYRVKCNIIRALTNFKYEEVEPYIFGSIKDEKLPVALTAARFFLDNGRAPLATRYWRAAKDSLHWQVQLTLYAAANRHLPYYYADSRKAINWELKRRFELATNLYEKATAIRALAELGWNYRYIKESTFLSDELVLRTAGVEAIAKILDKPPEDFRSYFGAGYRRVRQEMSNYLVEAIQNGDPGMMFAAAETLRNPAYFFKGTLDSLDFLEKALQKLKLPREIETYHAVKKTLDYFKGNIESEPLKPDFNHPIEWRIFNTLDEKPRALLKTTKGDITLELFPNIAPGTVTNFVNLVKSEFYNGKNFHRVVPNFVIQGGCPRGDGFGSLDYSIRSELPYLHYDAEGYVGMASAGNHTECTQFFITHSPTPHLDGNYTIFAKVTEGMDVVHEIEVGDVIKRIVIQ